MWYVRIILWLKVFFFSYSPFFHTKWKAIRGCQSFLSGQLEFWMVNLSFPISVSFVVFHSPPRLTRVDYSPTAASLHLRRLPHTAAPSASCSNDCIAAPHHHSNAIGPTTSTSTATSNGSGWATRSLRPTDADRGGVDAVSQPSQGASGSADPATRSETPMDASILCVMSDAASDRATTSSYLIQMLHPLEGRCSLPKSGARCCERARLAAGGLRVLAECVAGQGTWPRHWVPRQGPSLLSFHTQSAAMDVLSGDDKEPVLLYRASCTTRGKRSADLLLALPMKNSSSCLCVLPAGIGIFSDETELIVQDNQTPRGRDYAGWCFLEPRRIQGCRLQSTHYCLFLSFSYAWVVFLLLELKKKGILRLSGLSWDLYFILLMLLALIVLQCFPHRKKIITTTMTMISVKMWKAAFWSSFHSHRCLYWTNQVYQFSSLTLLHFLLWF